MKKQIQQKYFESQNQNFRVTRSRKKNFIAFNWDFEFYQLRQDILNFGRKLDEFEMRLKNKRKNVQVKDESELMDSEMRQWGYLGSLDESKSEDSKPCFNRDEPKLCQWMNCKLNFNDTVSILDHLEVHARALEQSPVLLCLWQGCKASGKHFRSIKYLIAHLVQHAGKNPYMCIIRNCKKQFPVLSLLKKHVTLHFLSEEHSFSEFDAMKSTKSTSSGSSSSTKGSNETMDEEDIFTPTVMKKVFQVNETVRKIFTRGIWSLHHNNEILFSNVVLGNRMDNSGTRSFLLHWIPDNILCDEWVTQSDYVPSKTVNISSLDLEQKEILHDFIESKCLETF